MLSRALSALFLWVFAAACFAQTHVTWSVTTKPASSGLTNLVLHAKIDPGWHLYSIVPVKGDGPQPTKVTVEPPLVATSPVQEGKATSKLDPNFGLVVQYFENSADFTLPVKANGAPTGTVDVRFQLCNDSMCIPPSTVKVPIGGSSAAAGPASPASSDDFHQKEDQGLLPFIGFSFVAGLLSLLTPCVFPMIPITVSYFSKRRNQPVKEAQADVGSAYPRSKSDAAGRAGFKEALAYCAGIVGTYAVFGIGVSLVFGASGIQRFATNPFVNLALALLFVVLALSLLGVYTINLPSGLVNRFSGAQGKGGLLGPALMGLTFTLTSFTCTVPFVGTILAGASQGQLFYPVVGMLAYGTAFALPFFLLALFPQYLARLPKSGSWLETVKAFMGFIEIAAALKFFSNADLVLQTNLISRPTFLGIWAAVFLVAGLFLLGVVPLPKIERPNKLGPVRVGFGIASVGLAVWFGTSIGGKPLGELEAFMPPTDHGWIKDYEKAVALAQRTNRPILINFTGVTCTNCRWMESNMFTRDDVKKELSRYVTVELYTDREQSGDVANKALEQKLTGTVTLPEYVRLTPSGNKQDAFGGSTRNPSEFIDFLQGGKTTMQAKR